MSGVVVVDVSVVVVVAVVVVDVSVVVEVVVVVDAVVTVTTAKAAVAGPFSITEYGPVTLGLNVVTIKVNT